MLCGFLYIEAFVEPFLVFCYHACRVFRGQPLPRTTSRSLRRDPGRGRWIKARKKTRVANVIKGGDQNPYPYADDSPD